MKQEKGDYEPLITLVSPGSGQGSGLKLFRSLTPFDLQESPLAPVRGAD